MVGRGWNPVGGMGRAGDCEPGSSTCSLDCIRAGERLSIDSIQDEHARVQALRFGMAEGASVECVNRIPAGPLVLKSGRQEIAVGRSLAKRIQVRRHGGV